MKKGFGKKLASLFNRSVQYEEFFEDLEDLLIEGDLGAAIAMEVSEDLREYCRTTKQASEQEMLLEIKRMLSQWVAPLNLEITDPPQVLLVLGVNGVGKTTTIAKMAHYYQKKGHGVVMSASDTFRAAAIDQLELHAQRVGCRIIKQKPGSDPGAVVYDAIESARSRKDDLILVDTAGRMHTKANLVRELQKIHKIIEGRLSSGKCRNLLVIDATTGQNGFQQAELFHEAVGIDGLILTKYDSASKGGTVVQIGRRLGIPVAFVGVGETYDDLLPFDGDEFFDSLLGIS